MRKTEGRGQGRRAVVICQSVGLSLSQRQAEVVFFFFWYLKLAIIMLSTEGGRRRLVDLHIKRNEKNRVSVLDNAVFGLYIC